MFSLLFVELEPYYRLGRRIVRRGDVRFAMKLRTPRRFLLGGDFAVHSVWGFGLFVLAIFALGGIRDLGSI